MILVKESKNGEGHNMIKTNNTKALVQNLFWTEFMNLPLRSMIWILPSVKLGRCGVILLFEMTVL